jgi:hypothetical protein
MVSCAMSGASMAGPMLQVGTHARERTSSGPKVVDDDDVARANDLASNASRRVESGVPRDGQRASGAQHVLPRRVRP